MPTSEERRKILELVAGGKLDAGEAADLLGAMPTAAEDPGVPVARAAEKAPAEPENGGSPRWLHIRVGDLHSGKHKVSVNIPLRLLQVGLRIGSGFAPELREIEWKDVAEALAAGERGILVDVEDEEDGEHVQIYVD